MSGTLVYSFIRMDQDARQKKLKKVKANVEKMFDNIAKIVELAKTEEDEDPDEIEEGATSPQPQLTATPKTETRKAYKCVQCESSYTRRHALSRHVTEKHNARGPKCKFCGEKKRDKKRVDSHENMYKKNPKNTLK